MHKDCYKIPILKVFGWIIVKLILSAIGLWVKIHLILMVQILVVSLR